jgi:hypothetical protein
MRASVLPTRLMYASHLCACSVHMWASMDCHTLVMWRLITCICAVPAGWGAGH